MTTTPKLPANVAQILRPIEQLLKSGQFEKALALAQDAAKQFPRLPVAQMMLGAALAELGRVNEAIKQFEKVGRIDPKNADVWRNIGILQQGANNHAAAVISLKKAIALNPSLAPAYSALGTAYDSLGEQDLALKAYSKVVELMPKSPIAYNNLLIQLEISNDLEGLATVLEAARKNIPGNAIVTLFDGVLAHRNGDLGTARKYLESVRFDLPPYVNLIIEMNRCGHLGKICDKLGDYETAFKYFVKTKSYLAQQSKERGFDAESYLKLTSVTLGYLEGKMYADWKPYDLPDTDGPIFLVGFPRSGTTLLDTILRSHPDIEVVEEGPAVRKLLDALVAINPDRNVGLANMTAKQAAELRKVYFKTLHAGVTGSGKVIIDKLPLNILHTVAICRVFPNARFIMTLRHPADSVLSNFMQVYGQNRAMNAMNKLSTAAQYYDLVMRIWEQSLPLIEDRFVESRYEDLVDDMQKTLTPVLKLLGLEWDENMENYRQTALDRGRIRTPSYNQVVKPLYKDAQQRWKNYAKPMAGILPLLEPWAERFGYGPLGD